MRGDRLEQVVYLVRMIVELEKERGVAKELCGGVQRPERVPQAVEYVCGALARPIGVHVAGSCLIVLRHVDSAAQVRAVAGTYVRVSRRGRTRAPGRRLYKAPHGMQDPHPLPLFERVPY